MTLAEAIYQQSLKLPDAAAREALDFIEFLSQRYGVEATAAYDQWFKTQVQQALDDSRPGIPDDVAREHFAKRRAALQPE